MQWKIPYFPPFKNNTLKLIYEIITKKYLTQFSFLFILLLFFQILQLYIGVYKFVTLYILIMEP